MKSAAEVFDSAANFLSRDRVKERICYFLLLFIVLLFPCFIMHGAEWVMGDDYEFLTTTAIGKPEGLSRHIGQEGAPNGRFYPLGHYDYNILTLLPGCGSPAAHYVYVSLSFEAAVFLLWLLLIGNDRGDGRKPDLYFNVTAVYLLIFSTGFMLLYYRGVKKQNAVCYTLAFLTACYASYVKEPVFGVFIVIAASNFIFAYKKLSRKDIVFNSALLLNGAVFLTLYYILSLSTSVSVYRCDDPLPFFRLLFTVFSGEPVLAIIFAAAAIRIFKIITDRDKYARFYDELIFAAAAYSTAYIILNYNSSYYFAPSIIIGLVPLAYWSAYLIRNDKKAAVLLMSALCIIPLANIKPVFNSATAITSERSKVMPGIKMMAEIHNAGGKIYWYQPAGDGQDIFNLTNFYINFVNGTKNRLYLTKIDDVPNLRENDLFLYKIFGNSRYTVNTDIIRRLKAQNFRAFQFQTAFLIFKNDNGYDKGINRRNTL